MVVKTGIAKIITRPALDTIFMYQYWELTQLTLYIYMGKCPPAKKTVKTRVLPGCHGWVGLVI